MTNYFKKTTASAVVLSAIALAGCGGSGSVEEATTGFMSLGISDGPIHDAVKVCITFNEIELMGDSGSTVIPLDPVRKVNLLAFQGANAAPLLIDEEVPAGNYQWMRLGVDAVRGGSGGADDSGGVECDGSASYMTMEDGRLFNLYVPSGANTGLKLVSGFTVPANGSPDFTAEFDLGRSITAPPGLSPDAILKPVIRLVNNIEVGTLSGMAQTELATAEACEPSVYLFDDSVTPNPIGIDDDPESEDLDPNDPVATAMVSEQTNDDGSVTWNYTIGFLQAPAEYEAAFTCDGVVFEPVDGKPAPIAVGETTLVDFEVPTS